MPSPSGRASAVTNELVCHRWKFCWNHAIDSWHRRSRLQGMSNKVLFVQGRPVVQNTQVPCLCFKGLLVRHTHLLKMAFFCLVDLLHHSLLATFSWRSLSELPQNSHASRGTRRASWCLTIYAHRLKANYTKSQLVGILVSCHCFGRMRPWIASTLGTVPSMCL